MRACDLCEDKRASTKIFEARVYIPSPVVDEPPSITVEVCDEHAAWLLAAVDQRMEEPLP